MQWIRERPILSGWYWTIEEWDDEPLLFEVEQTPTGFYCGERPLYHRAWDRTWWFGPLEIPKPPPLPTGPGDSNG